jgi:hypothetical protein
VRGPGAWLALGAARGRPVAARCPKSDKKSDASKVEISYLFYLTRDPLTFTKTLHPSFHTSLALLFQEGDRRRLRFGACGHNFLQFSCVTVSVTSNLNGVSEPDWRTYFF